jgi:hypothetical protein
MSLSSMAQQSALRLGAPVPTTDQRIASAADAAASAVRRAVTPEEAAREVREAAAAPAAPGTPGAPEPSVPSGPLSQLVTYIPTETITLYVALQAALGDVAAPEGGSVADADFSAHWVWTWIMVGVTLLLALGLSYRAQKDAETERFKVPVFETLAAGAAFLVWAFALPSTPLRDIEGFDYSAWNAFIILAGTVTISTVAYVLGKTVDWTKTVQA